MPVVITKLWSKIHYNVGLAEAENMGHEHSQALLVEYTHTFIFACTCNMYKPRWHHYIWNKSAENQNHWNKHIAAVVIVTRAHCCLTAAGHCYVMLGTIKFVDKSVNDNSARRLYHCDIIASRNEVRWVCPLVCFTAKLNSNSFRAAHLGSNTNQHTDWTVGDACIKSSRLVYGPRLAQSMRLGIMTGLLGYCSSSTLGSMANDYVRSLATLGFWLHHSPCSLGCWTN